MEQTVLDRPIHTLQDIFIDHFDDYVKDPARRLPMNNHIFKTVNQIRSCRTPKIGVYLVGCKCCGDSKVIPRSCKNRFCSKCGTADTMNWVDSISSKVPDIKHYHFVFTLPLEIRILAKRNPKLFYDNLFQSSQLSVKEVFSSKGNLQPGLICVLHTNGSDLKYHPHIHMIVSGGGFDKNKELHELPKDFLIEQRKLANIFRAKFMSSLRRSCRKKLVWLPRMLRNKKRRKRYFAKISQKQWIVNIEAPIKGATKIIAYVGRYTKKSCISERRILAVKDGNVTISYKDYKNSARGSKPVDGILTLTIAEFFDRLLQHVPLQGLKVVRYYGMYASSNWKNIPKDRRIKKVDFRESEGEELFSTIETASILTTYRESMLEKTGIDPMYCYHCRLEMEILELCYVNYHGQERQVKFEDNQPINFGCG